MSFNELEISNSAGRPIYFYEFRWGNTEWFYTSAPKVQTLGVQDYLPVAITDGGLTVGGQQQADFTITCDESLPVVGLFRGSPPSENVRVVAIRKHEGDAETTIFFAGKINNVKRSATKGNAEILCSTGKQRRGGLRLTWSRSCPHIVYDAQCKLLLADHAYAAEILSVTGNSFVVTAPPVATVGFFDGGIISWDADGLGTLEQRTVEKGNSTTEFVMFGRTDGLEAGQAVTLHPGCNRVALTCDEKFDNLDNYGGIVQMPGESPYGQNLF